MAHGEIRARYTSEEDDPRERTARTRDDDSVRSDCGWDAPCRLLAGVFLGMGDAIGSAGDRVRRFESDSSRRADEGERRSRSACFDYEFDCRSDDAADSGRSSGTAKASVRTDSGSSFDLDVRGERSEPRA